MEQHNESIIETINSKIKGINGKCRPITNCYSMSVVHNSSAVWSIDDSFIFNYRDHGVNRLVYFAENENYLPRLMKMPERISETYYIEFLTRNKDEYEEILENAGFAAHAKMMRLVNPDCRDLGSVAELGNGDAGTVASRADAHEINNLLWSTFRTEISHLLTDEELADEIEKGHTRIHRGKGGEIDALLQADVMPRKFYINQVINKGDRRNIHSILQKELADYIINGGKYLYAWVEESNMASVKFHEKYNMKHDGMWSMIYRME